MKANHECIVSLAHVTKYFDQSRPVSLWKREHSRIYALNDVSFVLRRGEFAAYAGPNGAGKSTTFKLLAGLLRAQQGQVKIFGADPCVKRIEVMRRTGVLFGNRSELWWDHPVRASFEWKKAVWDIPDNVYLSNVSRLKELLDLEPLWNTFSRELSLGQRMRADLALTLLHSPELVLLDEPTLGLDVLAKRIMIDFLKLANQELGVTLMVTSHDMDDLAEMANRLLLINRGRLAFDGSYDALLRMTGDHRLVRLTTSAESPVPEGLTLVDRSGDRFTYRYDGTKIPSPHLFTLLAGIPGIRDIQMEPENIETVIAGLYRKWFSEGEADYSSKG